MKIKLKCQECEKTFTTDYKHRDKKFCNRNCYFSYARKNKIIGKVKDDTTREIRNCLQCGTEFVERKKYQRKLCSSECRLIWNSNEENKKNRIDKSKEKMLEKYGVDSLFKIKSNPKNSFFEKYGVSHPMYVPEIVEKLKQTIREKHIVELISRLKSHNLILLDEYSVNKNGNTSKPYNFKCLSCDNIFTSTLLGSGKIPICRKCFPIIKNSKLEEILKDFLNENNIKHIDNSRNLLNGGEIDLYIPEFNLGIEINGNYYHSEEFGKKDKNYHLNKSKLANEKKIKLIQIFEDELILKRDITLSRISSFLNLNKKIYARSCEIKEISKVDSIKFLEENHIQGKCIDKYRYGLYHKDELVSIMTFGHKRKVLGNKEKLNQEFELIRFCNKININVVGGFSKLLKRFILEKKPKTIITYADIRWSGLNPEKTVYYKNNFTYVENTPPNYWYVNTKNFLNRHHRFVFRKDILVKEGYSKEKTEWEIMKEKKYDRIWDCGSMKFELKNPSK